MSHPKVYNSTGCWRKKPRITNGLMSVLITFALLWSGNGRHCPPFLFPPSPPRGERAGVRSHCPFCFRGVRPFLLSQTNTMGKKARMKVMRQIAAQLPAMNSRAYGKSIVSGADLIDKGVTSINVGNTAEARVIADRKYIESNVVPVPVNHARRIRKIHTAMGVEGIKAYVKHINSQMEKQLAKTETATPWTGL